MRANISRVDAAVRWSLAVVFLVLAVILNPELILSLVAALCALFFAATALTRNCPLYTLFGLDTRTHDTHPHHR